VIVDCEEIRPLLSAYWDGELDPVQAEIVAAHIAVCAQCAAIVAEYRSLGRQIVALPDVPPPAGLSLPAYDRSHRYQTIRRFGTRLAFNGLAAAILVVVLIGMAAGMSAVLQRMRVAGQEAAVIATYPPEGAHDVPLNTNLTLTFSRAMDESSVEAATYIAPAAPLAFAWQGETVTIVPFVDWRVGTTYTLTVAGTARGRDGTLLKSPFVLHFRTAGIPPGREPPESLNPIGRFALVWRSELGGPTGPLGYAIAPEQELWSARQHFERGMMIWLDQLYEDQIYVLYYGSDETSGDWQRYVDLWREGDPEKAGLTPPEGLYEPIRGFGRLWRDELGGQAAPIGWALEPEQGFVGCIQSFEHGTMVWVAPDCIVYVLWEDGSWTAYPEP